MNFNQLCRVCAESDKEMQHIAKSIAPRINVTCSSVVELWNIFSKLLVDENNDLPNQICIKCLDNIHQSYDFLEKCETSRQHLIQIRDQQYVSIEEETATPKESKHSVGIKVEVSEEELLADVKTFIQPAENKFIEIVTNEVDEFTIVDAGIEVEVTPQLPQENEIDIFEENGNYKELEDDEADEGLADDNLEPDMGGEPEMNEDDEDDDDDDEDWQPLSQLIARNQENKLSTTNSDDNDENDDNQKVRRKRRSKFGDGLEKYTCNICDKEFDKKSRLARHMKSHTSGRRRKKEPLECDVCKKTFEKKSRLIRHMNVHDPDGRPFECEVCKVRFVHESNMRRHAIVHTEVINESSTILKQQTVFKCIECPKEFAKQESLASHMRTHRSKGEKKSYTCEICKQVYPQLNLLTRHMKSHEEYRNYQCNICGKRFALTSRLIDHINRHNGVKPHVCHFCNKAFLQSCTLKDHLRTHTGEQPYLCAQCGKAFNNGSNLRQHLLRHTGIKPFACPECPSRFACKGELKGHMTTHQNIKPYSCDQCDSRFTKPQSLKKHMRIHTGERPYACEACGMTFTSSYPLKRHMRTHTGEKPYKCKFCERSFAQSNDLVKHTRSHVGENTYQCDECPAAFRLHNELRAHIQEHFREKNDRKDLMDDLKAALMKQKAAAEQGKFMSAVLPQVLPIAIKEPVEETDNLPSTTVE